MILSLLQIQPQCIFETINKYQWNTKSMFIEKPIFSTYEMQMPEINEQCTFYTACPIRYKKVIQYVKNNIQLEDILSTISICSSYLPEWRDGIDYRVSYSAKKNMGGGTSLDLIHEIDYLTYLFGPPREIFNLRGQVSNLEIDCEDISTYLIKFNNTVSQVYLDYFGRKDIRKFLLITTQNTIEIDLLKNKICFLIVMKQFYLMKLEMTSR